MSYIFGFNKYFWKSDKGGEMASIRADQVILQRINRITVLRYIKREEPISRIDLSKRTGLSPSTITNITH
ncbi:MAG TPA: winged helix-turn-helix transcriptional regulator, partial [Firmicutes bacterium]|nr:winged helix-turn-helix transcriptional regulator [Bacillota bacterium]